MSNAAEPEKKEGAESEAAPKPKANLAALPIVPLVNTLVVLAALGMTVYTKLIFKRPPIREETEREKLLKKHELALPNENLKPGYVNFESMTANIASMPLHPKPADGTPTQIEGKLHYATIAFTMEIRDESKVEVINAIRAHFLDKVNQILGRKQFQELSNVQGRYLFQTELIDAANQLVATHMPKDNIAGGLVTRVFFTQFLVQ